jgi:hypothetical protein
MGEIVSVARLRDAAGSLRQLVVLLDRLSASGAHLKAEDVGLDTRTPEGRRAVVLIRELERWQRDPDRPRGRPGLARHHPDVAERIGALRERGLSLQAIADALNADKVPTPRGGAVWRPSSVQSALGYRRPPPPPPGHAGPPHAPRHPKRPKPR